MAKLEKDTKAMHCNKCNDKTQHLMTGFRKAFEGQWWRGLICGEEHDA